MDETTENFLKVMSEFQWPEPLKVSYRLYYDGSGNPIVYTMEDLPGNYIEVAREEYLLGRIDCRVVDGRIVYFNKKTTVKLRPGDIGTPCHPKNICVIKDSEPNIRWSIEYNEKN